MSQRIDYRPAGARQTLTNPRQAAGNLMGQTRGVDVVMVVRHAGQASENG